jgi:hypothetical protein
MKKPILILGVVFTSTFAFSQDVSITNHAKELLEMTGSGKVGVQVMNNMISAFKTKLPNVPVEFWDEISKEVNPEGLIELVAPIYAKYYTNDELLQLLEFYKSPLGKKVIANMPLITQDSYQIGEEWGRKIGERVERRLKEKGYLKTI